MSDKVAIFSIFLYLLFLIDNCECSLKPPSVSDNLLETFGSLVGKQGAKWLCFFFGMCALASKPPTTRSGDPLVPLFEWSQVEYEYDSAADRQRDIDSGFFIPGVPAIIDVDVYYAPDKTNNVFVTIPRFQLGSPATLGEVTFDTYRGNYLIRPFPSWSWHRNPRQCRRNRIVSVYRVQIDECGRLWVLDTGRFGDDLVCPPQILAFDLKTKELLIRYEIPRNQYELRSIFVTPIVDVRNSCQNTFVYAADCQTFSLVVYDVNRNQSWKITDKTMYPYPNFGTYSILGDTFDLMDGILGVSISPYIAGFDRILYYHAMSSGTENWVYTSDIRNQSRFITPDSSPEIFHTYKGQRWTQSGAEAVDRNGIMYFGLMSDVTFDCWDTSSEYGPRNIKVISNNKTTLQFASGVKVIQNTKGDQELFVLTSRFQKVATGTMSTNEINFRILAAKIDDNILKRCKTYSSFPQEFGPSIGNGFGLRPKPPGFFPFRSGTNNES